MLQFMAYAVLVGLLFSAAAAAADFAFAARSWSRRGIWFVSLVASVVFPTAVSLMTAPAQLSAASTSAAAVPVQPRAGNIPTSAHSAPQLTAPTGPSAARPPAPRRNSTRGIQLDSVLPALWIASSACVLTFYFITWLGLLRLRARWRRDHIDGVSVCLSPNIGPAVFGIWRPDIIVPLWIRRTSPTARSLVLAHEREHIAARDPLLLFTALLLTAVMPWSISLWWQLRQLRFAIEVDCDARVLRQGADATAYTHALLAIGQHRFDTPLHNMALGAGMPQLERRIRVLLGRARRVSRLLFAAASVLSVSLVFATTRLTAPTLSHAKVLRKLPPESTAPGARWAQEAARARFPELFTTHLDGVAVVTVIFNPDGSLIHADSTIVPAGSLPTTRFEAAQAAAAGAEEQDIAYADEEDAAGVTVPNRIEIHYAVLNWPVDPTRSAARVVAAVRERFPDLVGETTGGMTYLTLFMNDNGTINQAHVTRHATGPVPSPGNPAEFAALGIDPSVLGRRGLAVARNTIIVYAWPRRPDDDPANLLVRRSAIATQASDADDRAIIQQYFSDPASSAPLADGERRWILLGRDGRVWASGRGFEGRSELDSELEAAFPGITVGDPGTGFNCLGATPDERKALRVTCVWIAAYSSVIDPADIDLAVRPDVFVTVDSTSEMRGWPIVRTSVPLKFGVTTAFRWPRDHWHLSAQPVAGDQVRITLDMSPADTETPSQATVQIPVGQAGTLQVTDSESHVWNFTLRPLRLPNAS